MTRAACICLFLSSLAGAQDWPQFRGPDGQGHAEVKSLPLEWSETSPNIKWRTPIPGLGWSSPIVANGRVWITAATDAGQSLRAVCLDAATGKGLVDVEVFRLPAPAPIHKKNSHASPTPIADGDRVYVHFGSYGTACLSDQGKIIWKQQIRYSPVHGPGGSPALAGESLIFSCDGSDTQSVVALDRKTGRQKWSVPRAGSASAKKFAFSTPLVIELDGRRQVISPGAGVVAGYDAESGRPIWWVSYGEGYSVIPRPVYGHGLVFLSSGFDRPVLMAIRPDGKGDVTNTHVAWRVDRNAPLSPSPLLVGDELYVVSDQGIATCLDAVSGAVHWRERLGGNFSASPLHAGDRIYFQDEEGGTTVLKPGRTFTKLARNELRARTFASLAPVEGALFLRTDKHLLRIEAEPQK